MAASNLQIAVPCSAELREIPASRGRAPRNSKAIGLAFERGAPFLSFGTLEDGLSFSLSAIQRVHVKHVSQGKATLELSPGRASATPTNSVLVSDADPGELTALLSLLEVFMTRLRSKNKLEQKDFAVLAEKHFPEQMKKQLLKIREATSGQGPVASKDHKHFMLLLDGQGLTPGEVGQKLCAIAADFNLSAVIRKSEASTQAFSAVAKDGSKTVQMTMSVRCCSHHKFKRAIWLELDVGSAVGAAALQPKLFGIVPKAEASKRIALTCLPHGGVKERLPGGLIAHLRSGLVGGKSGGGVGHSQFATRIELRSEYGVEGGEALGKAELCYWEPGSSIGGPVCTHFQMHREACRAYRLSDGMSAAALAATLAERTEVFCTRLAASASGATMRPKLLVAGWLPQVTTVAFVARGFTFEPDEQALGYKMLTPAALSDPRKRKRPQASEQSESGAAPRTKERADGSASPPADGSPASGRSMHQTRDSEVSEGVTLRGDATRLGSEERSAHALPQVNTPKGAASGGRVTGQRISSELPVHPSAALPSPTVDSDACKSVWESTPQTVRASSAASQVDHEHSAAAAEPHKEVLDLGELADLGKVKSPAQIHPKATPASAPAHAPASAPAPAPSADWAAAADMDEVDATLAELLG